MLASKLSLALTEPQRLVSPINQEDDNCEASISMIQDDAVISQSSSSLALDDGLESNFSEARAAIAWIMKQKWSGPIVREFGDLSEVFKTLLMSCLQITRQILCLVDFGSQIEQETKK